MELIEATVTPGPRHVLRRFLGPRWPSCSGLSSWRFPAVPATVVQNANRPTGRHWTDAVGRRYWQFTLSRCSCRNGQAVPDGPKKIPREHDSPWPQQSWGRSGRPYMSQAQVPHLTSRTSLLAAWSARTRLADRRRWLHDGTEYRRPGAAGGLRLADLVRPREPQVMSHENARPPAAGRTAGRDFFTDTRLQRLTNGAGSTTRMPAFAALNIAGSARSVIRSRRRNVSVDRGDRLGKSTEISAGQWPRHRRHGWPAPAAGYRSAPRATSNVGIGLSPPLRTRFVWPHSAVINHHACSSIRLRRNPPDARKIAGVGNWRNAYLTRLADHGTLRITAGHDWAEQHGLVRLDTKRE